MEFEELIRRLLMSPQDPELNHALQKHLLRSGKISNIFYKPVELDIEYVVKTINAELIKKKEHCNFRYASVSYKKTPLYRYRFSITNSAGGWGTGKFEIVIKNIEENSEEFVNSKKDGLLRNIPHMIQQLKSHLPLSKLRWKKITY